MFSLLNECYKSLSNWVRFLYQSIQIRAKPRIRQTIYFSEYNIHALIATFKVSVFCLCPTFFLHIQIISMEVIFLLTVMKPMFFTTLVVVCLNVKLKNRNKFEKS